MTTAAKETKRYDGEYAHRTFDKYAGMEAVIDRLAPKGTAEMNIKALRKGMEAYQENNSKRGAEVRRIDKGHRLV